MVKTKMKATQSCRSKRQAEDDAAKRRAAYHELLGKQFLRAFLSTCQEVRDVLDRIHC